jgi:hypothetical protein
MARIKLGDVVTAMSGKSGGTVYAVNKGGAYRKNKSNPTNPRSALQQAQRLLFSSLSSSWRGLEQEQRDSWKVAAPNFPYQDVFGDSRILSGAQLYSKLNLNISKVNGTLINSAPTPVEFPMFTAVLTTNTNVGQLITLDAVVPGNFKVIVRATQPFSAGIDNFKSQLRDVAVFDPGAGPGLNTFADYVLKLGVPTQGAKIGFSVQFVSLVSGQVSPLYLLSGLVG